MKLSAVLTNYNYGRFLTECIQSINSQTRRVDEIIIVDDGSIDNSRRILEKYKSDTRYKIITQRNRGQLASLNRACEVLTGDVVYFIDADDLWMPEYVELALRIHSKTRSPCIVFSEMKEFHSTLIKVPFDSFDYFSDVYSISRGRARFLGEWIGRPTSCISLKSRDLRKILPLPHLEEAWRIRADDVIVFGSSLLGFKKIIYSSVGILYRVHDANNFHGKVHSIIETYDYAQKKSRLIAEFDQRNKRSYGLIEFIKEFLLNDRRVLEVNVHRRILLRMYHAKVIKRFSLLIAGLLLNFFNRKFVPKKTTRCVIFGAGSSGLAIYNKLERRSTIVCFVDSDESKWGCKIGSITVHPPDILTKVDFEKVLIGGPSRRDIFNKLIRQLGVDKQKIVCVM
jgi:glycosyltransferase involved in cell wall biosynthesis